MTNNSTDRPTLYDTGT